MKYIIHILLLLCFHAPAISQTTPFPSGEGSGVGALGVGGGPTDAGGVPLGASLLFVELNCENLFDCDHDSLKNDYEFCEGGSYHWTHGRMWRKLNNIGREIISCGGQGDAWQKPDLVALVEVENDSVLTWLTQRSLLRNANYKYLMTDSPDQRGIDVALLFSEQSFIPLRHTSIRITPPEGSRPTRDILYVAGLWHAGRFAEKEKYGDDALLDDGKHGDDGRLGAGRHGDDGRRNGEYERLNGEYGWDDTLHVFVVHAPSRSGGAGATERYRIVVSERLCQSIDSIRLSSPQAHIIVAGDFNAYHTDNSVRMLEAHGMRNVSSKARGANGAEGTYRYRGVWGSLDHILVSEGLLSQLPECRCIINDAPFLVAEETRFGGVKPRRVYTGPRYDADGFSDHLPLVLKSQAPER